MVRANLTRPLTRIARSVVVAALILSGCSGGGSKDSSFTAPPPFVPVLTTVTVSLSVATIQVGQTATASALGFDQNGGSFGIGSVAWSTGSNAIATVTASGVVTGVAPGQVAISATVGSRTGQQSLTVIQVPVGSVTVAPAAVTLAVGATQQLTASTLDASGNALSGRAITWTTSDSTKAKVNAAGLVTAANSGIATITATSEGKSGTSAITVGLPAVASVSITPATASLAIGGTQQLTATLSDANGNVVTGRVILWTSSDPTKATVTSSGLVTATANGNTVVTATSEGKSASASVTVATAAIAVSSITPALLTPGILATVTGIGFSPSAGANTVTVEGVAATVVAASASQLTITIPLQLPCRPIHQTTVKVTAFGATAQGTQSLRVGSLRTLNAGASLVLTSPADLYCTELPGGTSVYLMSVYSISQTPTATFPFRFRGDSSAAPGASSATVISSSLASPRSDARFFSAGSPLPSAKLPGFSEAVHARVLAANAALYPMARREMQRRLADGRAAKSGRQLSLAAAAIAAAGSTRKFRVNQFTVSVNGGGNCTSYAEITARLVYVGTKSLVYEDVAAPLAGTMDNYFVRMGQDFDATMYRSDSTYFGDPLATDPFTDQDQHLSMVFTPQIPTGLAGFVTSCDFFQRDSTTNTTSNFGEAFYGVVPTVPGTGYASNTADQWYRTMRKTVVHEVKHIASMGARILNNSPTLEESWLEEGMARMAEEMWLRKNIYFAAWKGNATYAATGYCDVRPTFQSCTGAPFGILNHFETLWEILKAPSSYSMFGRVTNTDFHFYAETWSFVRWALDRYGVSESAFLRGITQAQTTGLSTISALTGHAADEMYGLWSLSQVFDDVAAYAGNSDLQFPTWNTPDIYAGLAADFPNSFSPAYPFTAFTFSNSSFAHDNSRVHGGGFDLYQLSGTLSGAQTFGIVGFGGIGSASSTLRIAISRTR